MSKKTTTPPAKLCCVVGCKKTKETNPECSFFQLPADADRRREWLNIIGKSDLLDRPNLNPRYYNVCSSHFDDDDLKVTINRVPGAAPSRNLPGKSLSVTPEGQLANTTLNWGNVVLVPSTPVTAATFVPPENRSIEVQDYEITPSSKNSLELDDEFTRNMRKLMQKKMITNTNKSSKDYLINALNLYLLNQQVYCFIRDALDLPSENTVRKIKLKLSPKLDKQILNCLSSKLKSFPDNAKYCTVCVEALDVNTNLYYDISNDELFGLQEIEGIKSDEVASVAYVAMLRGILVKWDQLVTYCFLANEEKLAQLEFWIDGVISSLLNIGFEVMALVTNQGSNFKHYATEMKGISQKKTYFTINNKQIYYIFDAPQLLNDIKYNLQSNDINYNGKVASWQYIVSLFQLENKRKHKIIPKITEEHVTACEIPKNTSVRFAAEIFSNTVSTAINAYVDINAMPEEARDTADFCVFLNNLFDVLNSSTYRNENIYKCALSSNQAQMKVLQEALDVFRTLIWKKTKKGNTKDNQQNQSSIELFKNFQVTLNSVLAISREFDRLGYKRFLTERLNLEPLAKFIELTGRVPSKNKRTAKPSAIQFNRNFTKVFMGNILLKPPYSNRPTAFEKYFVDALQLKATKTENILNRSPILLGGETDYRIELPEDHPTIYVASYIFYKCRQFHVPTCCYVLKNFTENLVNLSKTKVYDAYNRNASFYGQLKLLNYPFIKYIEQLERTFMLALQKGIYANSGLQLYTHLKYISLDAPPCPCFPKEFAVKLLIRLRMYTTLKAFNKLYKSRNIGDKPTFCEFLSEQRKLLLK